MFATIVLLATSVRADTLTHKETGETFTGKVCKAKINDRILVIKSDGTRMYLDLSEYEVIDDDKGEAEAEAALFKAEEERKAEAAERARAEVPEKEETKAETESAVGRDGPQEDVEPDDAGLSQAEEGEAGPDRKRQAELAKRKKDMEADLAALKKRLTRVPAYIDAFRAELENIRAAKGINSTGIVFGPDFALRAMAENWKIDAYNGNCVEALVPFSRELKQRGVDLMVVPYPTHAEVYGYRLFKEGKPEDELWPAKVEGLIKLLENDVEVIECGDLFKAYKGDRRRLLGAFDHHFDSAGIDIIAKELARRIRNRYDFAKATEEGRKLFTTQKVQVKTPTFFLNYNRISQQEAKALNIPPTIQVEQVTYSNDLWHSGHIPRIGLDGKLEIAKAKIEGIYPVFVMGDSSVPHGGQGPQGPYNKGWGIMSHLSKELGWLVPFTSDHWGGHKQLEWYVRSHAKTVPQPRVLILIMTGYTLFINSNATFHPRVGGWKVVHLPPAPAATAVTPDKKADTPPEPAAPFRATVELTKVSAPPDPKDTPYEEALTVSEAKVTKLWGKPEGVAVGDTILVVEWVMKKHKLIASAAALKAGDVRELSLVRWQKKINAGDEDTRMIRDDTENYDSEMYRVINAAD